MNNDSNIERSNQTRTLLAGIGIGAALMYLLDPERGGRRRAMMRDQAASLLKTSGRDLRDRTVDVRNRVGGKVVEMRNARHAEEPSDQQLAARVRSQLGHHVEHVRPIEVSVEAGCVTLRGPVLETELDEVISTVRSVRGVHDVVNQLDVQPIAVDVASHGQAGQGF
jgi:osmotically-inducible protein OsmY